jgi:hypothetical protein
MWDTVQIAPTLQTASTVLSHDMACPYCDHPLHVFLDCDDGCDCEPHALPGDTRLSTAGSGGQPRS